MQHTAALHYMINGRWPQNGCESQSLDILRQRRYSSRQLVYEGVPPVDLIVGKRIANAIMLCGSGTLPAHVP